jgi:hypothetical protein
MSEARIPIPPEHGQIFRLIGCWAKRQRAEEHVNEFAKELSQHLAFDPTLANIPSLHWAVVVGDAVHNFRSTLDHLVFQLVLMDGGAPTELTQFPIALGKGDFKRQAARRMRGVTAQHHDAVREFQPYRSEDPNFHPLALLKDLSNIDKHRVVHFVQVAVPPPDLAVRPDPYVAIGNGAPLLPILEMIRDCVSEVLDAFEPIFKSVLPRTAIPLPGSTAASQPEGSGGSRSHD